MNQPSKEEIEAALLREAREKWEAENKLWEVLHAMEDISENMHHDTSTRTMAYAIKLLLEKQIEKKD